MRTAIVTLTLGSPYEAAWNEVCAPTWYAYARRHGYDVIAINRPLDNSHLAASRSPAWQKLLVLGPEISDGYERIVWVDADIVINPHAPAITNGVPVDKIGAVDEWTLEGSRAFWQYAIDTSTSPRGAELCRRSAISPAEWHAAWGLPAQGDHVLQTGVMVLSPLHHRDLLQQIYRTYRCKGSAAFHFEMRPTSFEVQKHGLAYWMDKRFNALASFLLLTEHRRSPITTEAAYAAALYKFLGENYFLHLVGAKPAIGLLAEAGKKTLPPCHTQGAHGQARDGAACE